MKLRAKYSRSHYKSDSTYLTAVYRNNKAIIDEQLAGVGAEAGISTLKQFKYLVQETQQKIKRITGRKPAITTAMNRFTSSRDFTPTDLHMKENAQKGLRKFGALRTLYKLTGKKFDINDLSYIGDDMYSYRGYVISFDPSPRSIKLYRKVGGKEIASFSKQSEWYEI